MAKLNNTDGFILHGWMVNELKLKGGELFTYALIYQFSQSEAGIYKGGVPYLCLWTGWSENTIRKYLRKLEADGLVKSQRGDINGVPFCYYQTVNVPTPQNLKDTPQELKGDPSKSAVSTLQNLRGENNIGKIKGNSSGAKRFAKPTVQEIADYAKSIQFDLDAEYFFDYYERAGWTYGKTQKPIKDWKACVRLWKKKATPSAPPATGQSGSGQSKRFQVEVL